MAANKRELILAVLEAHTMTTSATYGKGGIRQWKRHCESCGAPLPWTEWMQPWREHQADVLVERLGL